MQKFVLKFLDDKSMELLKTSMVEETYEEAFRAAHTIKGICQNLSFTRLYESSSALSEALRDGFRPEAPRWQSRWSKTTRRRQLQFGNFKEGSRNEE